MLGTTSVPIRVAGRGHDSENEGDRTDVDKALLGHTTYRSLGEQQLSPAEERFEKGRRTIGLFLAPLITLAFLALPIDIPPNQQTLAGVLLGVIVLWVTEAVPIPIGGLLGVAIVVFLGVAPADEVLAAFGSSTIFTFIGAFILAQAMLKHGVARRFAFRILTLPRVGQSTTGVIVAFGTITCGLSAFVSNTATVAMLLPTALGILGVIAKLMQRRGVVAEDFDPLRVRVGAAIMLMLAYSASVGGLLTPVGSPPNLIGRGLIEEATGGADQLRAMDGDGHPDLPADVHRARHHPAAHQQTGDPAHRRRRRLPGGAARGNGSLSRAEKNTLIAFGVTVTLWILPGVVAVIAGNDSDLYGTISDRLDEGMVAVFGAALLYLLPTDWENREFTLTWRDAAEIDWGTIVLFGSGIIFGALLADTGLAETIGTSVADSLGLTSVVAITVFAVLLAIAVSETTSNTASAAVVVPIVIPVALAAGGVNPPFVLRSRPRSPRRSASCCRSRRRRTPWSTAPEPSGSPR